MPKEEFEAELPVTLGQANFLTALDVGKGKTVEIVEAPSLVDSQFGGKRCRISIKFSGEKEPKPWTMNNTTYRRLVVAFGTKPQKWVGRKVHLTVREVVVRGEVRKAVYGEPA